MPLITTERLRGEPLRSDHADSIYPLLLDDRIFTYLFEKPPVSINALRERYTFLSQGQSPDGTEQWLNWILFERESEEPIGFFQATVRADNCSIAYVLNPRFWGKGYAAEAAKAVISHLFETYAIPSVMAEINPRNAASQRLIKRLGFTFVRFDADEDDDIFEMTKTAWYAAM